MQSHSGTEHLVVGHREALLPLCLAVLISKSPHFLLEPFLWLSNKYRFYFCFEFLFVCFVLFVFQDRVSLCNSPGCPGACSLDQASLKLTDAFAS